MIVSKAEPFNKAPGRRLMWRQQLWSITAGSQSGKGDYEQGWALGIIVNMVVAVLLVHSRVGFFMNWNGNQQGEGYEFHLLAIALGLAILVKGAGAISIDRFLATRSPARRLSTVTT